MGQSKRRKETAFQAVGTGSSKAQRPEPPGHVGWSLRLGPWGKRLQGQAMADGEDGLLLQGQGRPGLCTRAKRWQDRGAF